MPSLTIDGPELSRPTVSLDTQFPMRSPSIRRELKLGGDNLRTMFQTNGMPVDTMIGADAELGREPATPVLPPTPPHIEGEQPEDELSSPDTTKMRSVLVTPVNQLSPPTPDITPPRTQRSRPFLGARPSMASTYAESFKTAQEEIASDPESNFSTHSLPMSRTGPSYHNSPLLPPLQVNGHKPSPLSQALSPVRDQGTERYSNVPIDVATDDIDEHRLVEPAADPAGEPVEDSPVIPAGIFPSMSSNIVTTSVRPLEQSIFSGRANARRGPSLRKRLEESKTIPQSPSIEKFADIIGWSESVHLEDRKRWSGMTTSTVEAIVIETPQNPKRRGTLRHVSKHNSLRSASSPLPRNHQAPSVTNSDSPHRLTHKRARLSNRNRESFGSDHSRSISLGSTFPAPRIDIIKVAVIPERLSSLQGSTVSSRRHSRSLSVGSAPARSRRESGNGSMNAHDQASAENGDRNRGRYYPPQSGPVIVPPRASSLSAPTSRNTSRANSLTSDSIRSARRQAEKELRTTLNKMESERLASGLVELPRTPARVIISNVDHTGHVQPPPASHNVTTAVHLHPPPPPIPGTAEWADLRPTSFLATPFSAPSFLSASPEISEARLISLFPHRNGSIQIIEPTLLPESQAVMAVRRQDPYHVRTHSPFREPRTAPSPPTLNPSSTSDRAEAFRQQLRSRRQNDAQVPLQSPHVQGQDRTNNFAKNFIRTVSLRNAKNKKADQDLDSRSHPMWRPQAFWDDPDAKKTTADDDHIQDRGIVQNSVGIPQQKSTFTGPIALMHRISNRRRNRRAVAKQSSYSSLHRLRTGKKLYRIPGLGIHLQMIGFRDIQERMSRKRLQRQDDERERRREELRKSIGPNVISTGDSRFMVTAAPDGVSSQGP